MVLGGRSGDKLGPKKADAVGITLYPALRNVGLIYTLVDSSFLQNKGGGIEYVVIE